MLWWRFTTSHRTAETRAYAEKRLHILVDSCRSGEAQDHLNARGVRAGAALVDRAGAHRKTCNSTAGLGWRENIHAGCAASTGWGRPGDMSLSSAVKANIIRSKCNE